MILSEEALQIPTFTPTTDLSDTGRVGTLHASREEIEHVFGAPHYTCDNAFAKITHQWAFRAEGGTVFTLYDYYWNPDGEYSIGGRGRQPASLVEAIFPGKVSAPGAAMNASFSPPDTNL